MRSRGGRSRRRTSGCLRYRQRQRENRSTGLEAALRRVIISGSRARQLTFAAAPNPTRSDIIRDYIRWHHVLRPQPNIIFFQVAEDIDNASTESFNNLILNENQGRRGIVMQPNWNPQSTPQPPLDEMPVTEDNSLIHVANLVGPEDSPPGVDSTMELTEERRDLTSTQEESATSLLVNVPSRTSDPGEEAFDDSATALQRPSSNLNVEEERRWLRYRVESLTRDECIVFCVLGHMLLNEDEMPGRRDMLPTDEDARQALLCLAMGSHWDVLNLGIVIDCAEKLSIVYKSLDSLGIRDRSAASRRILETRLDGFLGVHLNRNPRR